MVIFLLISRKIALAQPTKKGVKTNSGSRNNSTNSPEKVAEGLCNCFNNFFNQYHPSIKQYLEAILTIGEEKAFEKFQNYLMTLNKREQKKAVENAQRFGKYVDEGKLDVCTEKFQKSVA
ncbi:MAG: hypothetical protein NZ516_10185, partial [Raineya sp.]|nr:hypothetical protein [Raineya sp.]